MDNSCRHRGFLEVSWIPIYRQNRLIQGIPIGNEIEFLYRPVGVEILIGLMGYFCHSYKLELLSWILGKKRKGQVLLDEHFKQIAA